jgi:hypothetical protein
MLIFELFLDKQSGGNNGYSSANVATRGRGGPWSRDGSS